MFVDCILLFVRVVNQNRFFKNVKNQKPDHQRDQHRGRPGSLGSRYTKGLRHDVEETHPQEHSDRKALDVVHLFAVFYAEPSPRQGREKSNERK